MSAFVFCGFRTLSKPLQARSCSSASRLSSLKTGIGRGGFGGGGFFPRRDWNGWGDGDSPSVPLSAAVVINSRPRKRESLLARARYTGTNYPESWFSNLRVTNVLLAINMAVFALQFTTGGRLLSAGAKVNSAIAAGQWYRFFTPVFLHASLSHLLINSYSLYNCGPSVESWFGKKRFLALYAFSGLSGNALSFLCSPAPAVGASGAIFGLVGAMAVLLARHRSILRKSARSPLQTLGFIVMVNFAIGMTPGSQIDNFGHLGGLLGGLAFSYIAGPRLSRRRIAAGGTVLVDRPLYLDLLAEFRGRLRQLLSIFK